MSDDLISSTEDEAWIQPIHVSFLFGLFFPELGSVSETYYAFLMIIGNSNKQKNEKKTNNEVNGF